MKIIKILKNTIIGIFIAAVLLLGSACSDLFGTLENPVDPESTSWDITWAGISPANGGSILDTTPLLGWDDVTGAAGYKVRYANSSAGLEAATEYDVTASEYPISVVQTSDSTVYWQVRAVNEDGVNSVWSSVYDFTIVIDHIVEMVSITGGTFTMGDTWGLEVAGETPTHSVTLSDFSLGKYEVTFAEWDEVYDWAVTNGYNFANAGIAGNSGTGGGDTTDEPVTTINWRDVIVWCNAASEYKSLTPVYTYSSSVIKDSRDSNATACDNAVCDWTGNGYRLPTEAEWEYAAKGGNSDTNNEIYAGSATIGDVAWYSVNSGSDTKPVGTLAANELGLYDMSGNVWEWNWNWYESYSSTAQTDPVGPPSSGSGRSNRGGAWDNTESYGRVVQRNNPFPYDENSRGGFRLARSFAP